MSELDRQESQLSLTDWESEEMKKPIRASKSRSKMLRPGESKILRTSKFSQVTVVAECYDSDSPYITIKHGNQEITLTDFETSDLIQLLPKALAILPSSK